ncbi:hypothetical protein BV898_04091 [Hypsibius exemplaris]|uniref:Uncharacterized protein n=1 Tax=Hypsibius exemplaris TaxID=2072580 RepID=A0A1W0X2V7_HYPEX|nr:hypothetical protein BV898_04091 [Hypsibius exemplaris]
MKTVLCLFGFLALGTASALAVGDLPRVVVYDEDPSRNISANTGLPSLPSRPSVPSRPSTTPRTTTPLITTTPYVPVFDPTHTNVRIRLEQYSNRDHILSDGGNCEWWGGCDPYFNILYTSSHDGHLYNLTTPKGVNDNLPLVVLPLHLGGNNRNPILLRAPTGATIEVQITAYDEDLGILGGDELIGMWSFYYVVGEPGKRETKKDASGPATFTLSFEI